MVDTGQGRRLSDTVLANVQMFKCIGKVANIEAASLLDWL
jgi:hypothetical protein